MKEIEVKASTRLTASPGGCSHLPPSGDAAFANGETSYRPKPNSEGSRQG